MSSRSSFNMIDMVYMQNKILVTEFTFKIYINVYKSCFYKLLQYCLEPRHLPTINYSYSTFVQNKMLLKSTTCKAYKCLTKKPMITKQQNLQEIDMFSCKRFTSSFFFQWSSGLCMHHQTLALHSLFTVKNAWGGGRSCLHLAHTKQTRPALNLHHCGSRVKLTSTTHKPRDTSNDLPVLSILALPRGITNSGSNAASGISNCTPYMTSFSRTTTEIVKSRHYWVSRLYSALSL